MAKGKSPIAHLKPLIDQLMQKGVNDDYRGIGINGSNQPNSSFSYVLLLNS